MSEKIKIYSYGTITRVVTRLRDDLNSTDFVLIYAYNGTGKTRLSMAFKDKGKNRRRRRATVNNSVEAKGDTLYFNAYTEDLFHWDNDLNGDTARVLRINSESKFFNGFRELALEPKIFAYLERYANFDFDIDYTQWTISFSRGDATNIKVSRGEENIFIWCIYLAICELAIDGDETGPYNWVKYLYIDDPISSLDDNNAIAVASDLAQLIKRGKDKLKTVISSHHGLFFNVMCNELKKLSHKKYFFHSEKTSGKYTLRATDDTPFLHHVAMLSELQQAAILDTPAAPKLYTYHFNMLRSILERTATFFGYDDFSACIHGVKDEVLYGRALNLLSHGKHSAYEPRAMGDDTKDLFKNILSAFLAKYEFALPELLTEKPQKPATQPEIPVELIDPVDQA
ncbi:AAA family ATPase [Salmonella enterica subsp. enterica serovar Takoradi]|nr:anticodon nuclease [Salmonella enterica subsp. enterica]ECO3242053.1 AAA family ATPase [Salmonella enterica subsp. enterica serovar Utah]EDU6113436.1 AAA family ATPase [Salmonella enterica subsp. enterica serovar Splott]EHC7819013.1 AAA family ATPase [Salmonella enterica subsp. enterica serovar Takoradi]EJC9026526.1 AAA family ATPase [Salmonella enterica]